MGVKSIENRYEDSRRNGVPQYPAAGDRATRADEDRQLLVRYHREGDAAAREALVARFLPLARQLAAATSAAASSSTTSSRSRRSGC